MNVSALTSIFGEDRTVRPHEIALIINPNNDHIVTSEDTAGTMDCLGNGVFEEVAATGFRTKVQELKAHGFGVVAYVNTCSARYLNSAPNGLEPCYFNHCHTGRQGLRRASYVVKEMQKYQATFPGLLDGFFWTMLHILPRTPSSLIYKKWHSIVIPSLDRCSEIDVE